MGAILPFVPRVIFDDLATRSTTGEAFDAASKELHDTRQPRIVQEVMARTIIDAARTGERDVHRVRDAALAGLRKSPVAAMIHGGNPRAGLEK